MSAAQSLLSPKLIAEAISWRRHLHERPELAFAENQTAGFVAAQLARSGLRVHRGLAGTGVVGTLERGSSRRAIGIRADMDALPIEELNEFAHRSRARGAMHACGHDGHVAMALAAAEACAHSPDLDGTVHFIFQPGEEGAGGARRMVEEGLFRDFPCDAVYALHNWPALPLGTYVARDGPMMAASAQFGITLRGRSCHGAMPHEGADPILAAAQLISALQSVVSRNVHPLEAAVVSATQIHAGHADNVIPDTCTIRGTLRWFETRVGALLEERVREVVQSTARAFGCQGEFRYEPCYPPTLNDAKQAAFVRSVASAAPLGLERLDSLPSMGAEDFAYMAREVPACYFWLGSGSPGVHHSLHSQRYDFNDDLIPIGTALWVALVCRSLTSGPP